jgi:hypothetical protein
MKTFLSRLKIFALLAIPLIGFMACGTSGGDGTGQLSLSLTDKSSIDYDEVWVTIKDIYVHPATDPEDTWTKILDVNRTVDLLTLADGIRLELGMVDLPAGHYDQMRLMLGTVNTVDTALPAQYIVDSKGVSHELKVPSGVQSGIKLVQGFDINENSTTELIFDFDVSASIVARGHSGRYILRPTIHQIDDSQTRTIIKGTVVDAALAGMPGADIGLQIYKPRIEGQDFKDEIVTAYSTMTAPDSTTGAYQFWFLNIPEPVTFNIVASKWDSADDKNYAPDWKQILDAMNGKSIVVDDLEPVGPLTLVEAAEIGTLDLTAVIVDADTDKVPDDTNFVTLSIRQLSDLPGAPMVEIIKLVIVGYDDEWTLAEVDAEAVKLDLPYGDYAIVASFEGRISLEQTIHISASPAGPYKIAFSFPIPI